MKSNYKKLGEYIEPTDFRNKDSSKPLGLDAIKGISSIYKSFIKTKANLVGVNPGNYKVVKPHQFGFNPNTARMGDKIPIALNSGKNDVLVSSIYPTFKIIDENELLPEYLMMWFKRPEFDRYARFKSHGSAREIFDFDEMCGVELPVPPIEKQREIVKEYNTIVNRIKNNQKLIKQLNKTVDAFFQEFISFEKDSTAETIIDFIDGANTGLDAIKRAPIVNYDSGIKCLRIQDVSRDKGFDNWGFTEVEERNFKKFQLKKDDIIIARTGATVGAHVFIKKDFNSVFNNGLIRVRANKFKVYPSILYAFFSTKQFKEHVNSIAFGTSTQPNVKIGDLFSLNVSFPKIEEQKKIVSRFNALNNMILSNREQICALLKMQEILLSKMAKVESPKTEEAV